MTQPPVSSEGFSDSDEVFPKEMTKWNSNDFIDAFASPTEVEGVPGRDLISEYQTPALCVAGTQNSSALSEQDLRGVSVWQVDG